MTGSNWMHFFAAVGVLAAAIAAGGQLLVLLVILPVMRRWPVSLSVKTHQAMLDKLPDRYLPYCTGASLAAAIALLGLHDHLPATSAGLITAGLVGTLGVLVISVAFTRPASKVIAGWSIETIPAAYSQIRNRWDRMHALRTLFGTAALVCYLTASLALS